MKFTDKSTCIAYRIEIPKRRNCFYLIFRPPGQKAEKWVSLGTTNTEEAKAIGKRKFREAIDEIRNGKPAEVASAPVTGEQWPTVAELGESYQKHTAIKNAKKPLLDLLRILEVGLSLTREEALQVRADAITNELVRLYRMKARELFEERKEQAIASASNEQEMTAAQAMTFNKYGVNSRLAGAKSMFSDPDTYFPGMKLPPTIAAFRSARGEKNAYTQGGFVPLPAGTIPRMEKAAEELRDTMPMHRRAFLLFRHFGLRPEEALHAKGHWFEHDAAERKLYLAIRNRPEEGFFIKNGIEHFIEVPEHLVAEFSKFPHGEFVLVPDLRPTLRQRFLGRTMSEWVRLFIPDRDKSVYELRKHAGSEVYMSQGVEAAKYFLGHTNITTTQTWYASWLKRVKAANGVEAAAVDVSALTAAVRSLLDLMGANIQGEPLEKAKARVEGLLPPELQYQKAA